MLYLPKQLTSKALMSLRHLIYSTLAIILLILPTSRNNAANFPLYDSPELEVGLMPRPPQQIAAFYEARGFSQQMVETLKQQCFITVWVHNKSSHIIWLELPQWHFRNAQGVIERRDRYYWKSIWNKMQIPLAHQSTFRWTLLPEILDFQPGEREGGNIVLPRDNKPIQIQATFPTQRDKSGAPIALSFNNVQCANDP